MQDAPAPQGPTATTQRAGRRREWPLTLLALLLVTTVAILQRPGSPEPGRIEQAASGSTVPPLTFSPLIAIAKAVLWFNGQAGERVPASQLIEAIDPYAQTAADKFRVALLAGELAGRAAREDRFEKLKPDLAENSPLLQDMRTVEAIKATAELNEPAASVKAEDKAAFIERHGWFARMILADESPGGETAFERQVAHDGQLLIAMLFLIVVGVAVSLLTGIALFITALVKLGHGTLRARFVTTPPEMGSDRGLWLEMFCVFLVGFLLVQLGHFLLERWAGKDATWPITAALLLQWSLVLVLFWPLVRGMSWERFTGELGWHRGRGVLREIGSGIVGYLAGLPIYFGVFLLVLAGYAISEAIRRAAAGPGKPPPEMPMPDNKVFDLLSHSSGWELALLATLIVVWAPLVEESIFRGALFRHIRQRLPGWGGLTLTVILVAAAFALAHSYVIAGVIMVATLGGVFALMREWRGSLIAPMTAHCLHNGTVLAILVTMLPLMRG